MPTPRAGYRTKDGQKVPSVTTVLGRFKDSGGLIKWAYRQGREHENLAMRNLPAPSHLYDVTEKAAQAGTIAHHLIDTHIRHGADKVTASAAEEFPNVDPDVKRRAWNSYQQFIKWLTNSRMKVEGHERPLVSERHLFGGTPDATGIEEPDAVKADALIANADGTYTLVDWKTSNAVYGEYIIQLAAYAILIEEVEGIAINSAHLLRVAKESADFAHHYYGDLEREKKAFLLMRELYDHVYAIERRA